MTMAMTMTMTITMTMTMLGSNFVRERKKLRRKRVGSVILHSWENFGIYRKFFLLKLRKEIFPDGFISGSFRKLWGKFYLLGIKERVWPQSHFRIFLDVKLFLSLQKIFHVSKIYRKYLRIIFQIWRRYIFWFSFLGFNKSKSLRIFHTANPSKYEEKRDL